MNQTTLIHILTAASCAIPFLASFALIILKKRHESLLRAVIAASAILWFLSCVSLATVWLGLGARPHEWLVAQIDYRGSEGFPIWIIFDWFSLVFLMVTSILGCLIMKYCIYYLHREPGYARFFSTIYLFLGGMSLASCSGNLDLFFAAWEFIGISSFLLIAFYRTRFTAAQNAMKTFSIYRLCDVGLLLGGWLAHLSLHDTNRFLELARLGSTAVAGVSSAVLFCLSMLLFFAASGKSAQFPFSFWLPRALEGPTPSSAIFYGALSIHMGVLLLLRTSPIWDELWMTRVVLGMIGLVTAVVATFSGRVQANIKAQIGYASICQIGIMFIELAFGLRHWVLFHFAANAVLRCYQLLISPSVVAHLLRLQSNSLAQSRVWGRGLESVLIPKGFQKRLYGLSMNEFHMELICRSFLWKPINTIARVVNQANTPLVWYLGILSVLLLLVLHVVDPAYESHWQEVACVAGMVLTSAFALRERKNAFFIWSCLGVSCLFACLTVASCGAEGIYDCYLYLGGTLPAWILGIFALRVLVRNRQIDLRWHQGLAAEHEWAAFFLLLACLGISGFPITPAFVGEDFLLDRAIDSHIWLAGVMASAFVVNGLTALRFFSRLCFGTERITIFVH